MADLCIVTCGKKKIWDKNPYTGPTEAKNVYIGPLSKKGKEYAEKFYPDTWMILSAKHGFLDPKDIIPQNYDSSFNIKNSKTISLEELKIQIQNENLDEYERIIVLGGKYYTNIVINLFSDKEVINPLKDCKGIGYMLKKINDAIISDNKY